MEDRSTGIHGVVKNYTRDNGKRVLGFYCSYGCSPVPTTLIGHHMHQNHCETCEYNRKLPWWSFRVRKHGG